MTHRKGGVIRKAAARRELLELVIWALPELGERVRAFLTPLDKRLISELLWLPTGRAPAHRMSAEEECRLRTARLRILGGLPALGPVVA